MMKTRMRSWKVYLISLALPGLFQLSSCDRAKQGVEASENDQEAIRALIQNETECYYQQDIVCWRESFLDGSGFRMYAYWEGWPEKVKYYNGFEELYNEKRKQFEEDQTIWKNSVETRENENLRVSERMAWYTFEQKSYEKVTKALLGRSLETRILEKDNGKWKIAYIGYHYFPSDSTRKRTVSTPAFGSTARRN